MTQKPWTPSRQIHLPDSTWKGLKSLSPVVCSLAAHWGIALKLQPCTCPLSPSPRPPPQLIKHSDLSDKGHLCSHKLDWRVSTLSGQPGNTPLLIAAQELWSGGGGALKRDRGSPLVELLNTQRDWDQPVGPTWPGESGSGQCGP